MTDIDLLHGLPRAERDHVLALGERTTLAAGAELFHLGGEAGAIYVVARGRMRLTLPMQVRGREEDVLVEEHDSGHTLGWSALIPPYRFTLTATAQLESEVIGLPRAALTGYFDTHPETASVMSLNLAAVIGQRLQVFQAMWLREIQRMVELRCA